MELGLQEQFLAERRLLPLAWRSCTSLPPGSTDEAATRASPESKGQEFDWISYWEEERICSHVLWRLWKDRSSQRPSGKTL